MWGAQLAVSEGESGGGDKLRFLEVRFFPPLFQVSPDYFHFMAFIRFQVRKVQSFLRQSPTETQKLGNDRNILGKHCENCNTARILYTRLHFKFPSHPRKEEGV